ncbi:MAG: type II secretion system F family protein [Sedimentisphaerales bacterium]|nr:type II secretion system F family protein [Sedimentisphaerales bacterium]
MGRFSYKAVDKSGGHVAGTVEASDRKSAVALLAEQGHFVTELADKTGRAAGEGEAQSSFGLEKYFKLGSGRVTSKDLLAMTTQLGTALRAGLPMLNGLKLILEQQHKAGMKDMLGDIVDKVSSGQSLSDAMSRHGEVFSPLYLSMIRVGETGGILDDTTSQLAGILTRDEKIKTSMKNASAYPMFVLAIGMVSVAIIIGWILPNIIKTIDVGVALPWPTRLLMATSSFLRMLFTKFYGWVALAVMIGGVYKLARWTKTKGRLEWDSFKLRIPVLGSVLRTIAVGRFARTLGALTKGGVTILDALAVVRDTLGNEVLGREIDVVAEKVKRGEPLAEPLGESGLFPPLLVQITSIGEQTGRLDELLLNAAETFDSEADSAINRFMAIFPALLILLLAIVVGFIIVATLLPILIMQLGGGAL